MFGVPLKNLGLFVGVLVIATVIVLAVLFWLDKQFGFDGGAAGTWIGPFAAACITAGQSYAKKSDWTWTADDRHRLALAYSVVSSVIGLVFAGVYLVLDPQTFAILGTIWGLIILAFGALFGTLISYGIARLFLARAVRPTPQRNQP